MFFEFHEITIRNEHFNNNGYLSSSKEDKIPEISPEDEDIVDQWWEETMPFYKNRENDKVLKNIYSFSKEHTELFINLELHHEMIFEVCSDLGRHQRWDDYTELLIYLRKNHPEMYSLSCEYYDRHIIEALVASKSREKIPEFFSYFRKNHHEYWESSISIINLLAWVGYESELQNFLYIEEKENRSVDNIVCDIEGVYWLTIMKWMPYVNEKRYSLLDAELLRKDILSLDIPGLIIPDSEEYYKMLEMFSNDRSPEWNSFCDTEDDKYKFYRSRMWNFCGYLCRKKNFSFLSARFITEQLERYLFTVNKQKKTAFMKDFQTKVVEEYICSRLSRYLRVEGTLSFSLLQGIYFFADYLEENVILNKVECKQIRKNVSVLFNLCLENTESTDPAPRLFTDFPKWDF